jgi:uncharacterized protein (TIGR00251 family)
MRRLRIGIEIDVDNSEDHPLAVRRNLRLAYPLQLHHVVKRERMFRLSKERRTAREKKKIEKKTAHKSTSRNPADRQTDECSRSRFELLAPGSPHETSASRHRIARKNSITGELGDALKLSLTTPPIEGRANDACIEFFAKLLKVPRSSVTIASGQTSRNKVIRVAGVTAQQVRDRLQG